VKNNQLRLETINWKSCKVRKLCSIEFANQDQGKEWSRTPRFIL